MEPLDPRIKAVYQHEARLRMCRLYQERLMPLVYALAHDQEAPFLRLMEELLAQEQRDLSRALDRSVPVFKEQLAIHA